MSTATQQRLDVILTYPENWNSYKVARPSVTSVARAKVYIAQFELECGETWQEPNIMPDSWGDVVFEWRDINGKTLSLFVSAQTAEYLKVWDVNMVIDKLNVKMEDGDANTPEERAALWTWLMEVQH